MKTERKTTNMQIIATSDQGILANLSLEEFEALSGKKPKDSKVGETISLDKTVEIINSTLWLDSEAYYIAKQLLEMSKAVKSIKNLRATGNSMEKKEAVAST